MATIRPSSDLRNHYNDISNFCNQYHEPVYITRNGVSDLVILSNAAYERMTGELTLQRLLAEGLADADAGRTEPAESVFADLRKELGHGGA
jgi:PHD/YefM family antitoxin component YafN of YafNO toxin-antitoxin module